MTPTNKTIKVLHIDKDKPFLEVTLRILKLMGDFEVETAQTISEANTALSQKSYDAIISAYYLNGINGLEYHNQLRAKGINIPFIIFTINEESAKEAYKVGVPCITKYGDPEKVFAQLAQAIKNSIK
jgi:DNA-binding NtrC family response regulator